MLHKLNPNGLPFFYYWIIKQCDMSITVSTIAHVAVNGAGAADNIGRTVDILLFMRGDFTFSSLTVNCCLIRPVRERERRSINEKTQTLQARTQ